MINKYRINIINNSYCDSKRCDAIHDAYQSATGYVLLISECQDVLADLRRAGYYLKPIKSKKKQKAHKCEE